MRREFLRWTCRVAAAWAGLGLAGRVSAYQEPVGCGRSGPSLLQTEDLYVAGASDCGGPGDVLRQCLLGGPVQLPRQTGGCSREGCP
jgi:hypothetical protein